MEVVMWCIGLWSRTGLGDIFSLLILQSPISADSDFNPIPDHSRWCTVLLWKVGTLLCWRVNCSRMEAAEQIGMLFYLSMWSSSICFYLLWPLAPTTWMWVVLLFCQADACNGSVEKGRVSIILFQPELPTWSKMMDVCNLNCFSFPLVPANRHGTFNAHSTD